MDDTSYRAALVGSSRCCVRREIGPHLERELATWDMGEFPRLADLVAAVENEGYFADLVIICQSWRDEYATQEVKAALASLPVARWICVVGPWCESEGRHGSRWPLAIRVPLRSWSTRLANEIAVVQGRLPALAITAAREEVFEFDRQFRNPKPSAVPLTTTILSPDREWKSWMRDLCQRGGLQWIDAESGTSPDILIVDLDPLTSSTPAKIPSWKALYPQARFVGCLGIVYPEDRRRLKDRGVELILSKLTPASELLTTILEPQDSGFEVDE